MPVPLSRPVRLVLSVMAGVVVGFTTVPVNPLAVVIDTEVTVPDPPLPPPAGTAHTPSPRQNVVDPAFDPELRLATGRFPETPVVSGRFVQFTRFPDAGVPRIGFVSVGLTIVGDANVLLDKD